MADLIEFKRPEKPEPHIEGMCRCMACQHEWHAVAPVGQLGLECPQCHLLRGEWIWPIEPADGKSRFACKCNAQLFYYLETGWLLCAGCGQYHRPWE